MDGRCLESSDLVIGGPHVPYDSFLSQIDTCTCPPQSTIASVRYLRYRSLGLVAYTTSVLFGWAG